VAHRTAIERLQRLRFIVAPTLRDMGLAVWLATASDVDLLVMASCEDERDVQAFNSRPVRTSSVHRLIGDEHHV